MRRHFAIIPVTCTSAIRSTRGSSYCYVELSIGKMRKRTTVAVAILGGTLFLLLFRCYENVYAIYSITLRTYTILIASTEMRAVPPAHIVGFGDDSGKPEKEKSRPTFVQDLSALCVCRTLAHIHKHTHADSEMKRNNGQMARTTMYNQS